MPALERPNFLRDAARAVTNSVRFAMVAAAWTRSRHRARHGWRANPSAIRGREQRPVRYPAIVLKTQEKCPQ